MRRVIRSKITSETSQVRNASQLELKIEESDHFGGNVPSGLLHHTLQDSRLIESG